MPKYIELQERYNELKNQETEYWGFLRESIHEIVNRVAGALAIPHPSKLRLGVVLDSGEFVPRSAANLPEVHRSIEFCLLLLLDEVERAVPPSTLSSRWRISRNDKGIVLDSSGRKFSIESFDEAAGYIIDEFKRILENSDPLKQRDIF